MINDWPRNDAQFLWADQTSTYHTNDIMTHLGWDHLIFFLSTGLSDLNNDILSIRIYGRNSLSPPNNWGPVNIKIEP